MLKEISNEIYELVNRIKHRNYLSQKTNIKEYKKNKVNKSPIYSQKKISAVF